MTGTRRVLAWELGLVVAVLLVAAALGGLATGCSSNGNGGSYSPMGYPTPVPGASATPTATPGGPTPTPGATPVPTKTPVSVTAVGLSFSPSAISIPSGAPVSFNVPGHTVHIDDGTNSGICGSTDYQGPTWPFVYTQFIGVSGTVFRVHCDFHATCSGPAASSCASCTNMVMTVTIL